MAISTPNDLPNIAVWLDAQQHSASDNDPVSTATDYHTGGGVDFTGVTTTRPLYKTNIHNGHPVFRFDGTDDFLINVAIVLGQPCTVGIFARHSSGSVGGFEFFCGGAASESSIFVNDATPDVYGFYGGASVINTAVAADTSFHSFVGVFSGAASLLRIDAAETTGNPGTGGTVGYSIGAANSGSGGPADCDIGELVICTSALSAGNITDLEAYFTAHWAAAATGKPYYYHRNQ